MSDLIAKQSSIDVVCCFCGEQIVRSRHEPIELAVHHADDSVQGLYAHVDCLGSRLHPSVPYLSLRERANFE